VQPAVCRILLESQEKKWNNGEVTDSFTRKKRLFNGGRRKEECKVNFWSSVALDRKSPFLAAFGQDNLKKMKVLRKENLEFEKGKRSGGCCTGGFNGGF